MPYIQKTENTLCSFFGPLNWERVQARIPKINPRMYSVQMIIVLKCQKENHLEKNYCTETIVYRWTTMMIMMMITDPYTLIDWCLMPTLAIFQLHLCISWCLYIPITIIQPQINDREN